MCIQSLRNIGPAIILYPVHKNIDVTSTLGTVEPLLRGHPDERPPPLERPLGNVYLNKNELIPTPDERPPFLKGHFSDAKWVASQEGFHCTYNNKLGRGAPKEHLHKI